MTPYRINSIIIMPCYFVMNGKKQEMDEDVFDQMMSDLQELKALNNSEPPL